MKKSVLLLLTLTPVLVGYLINWLILVPVIGMPIFYIAPLLMLVFWFYLGGKYADSTWKAIPSILIAHAVGIVSVLLYIWQFIFETDETRNMAIAVFSQMFSAATPIYLFWGIARLFESQPNYAGRATMMAMQVIAVVVMILVFTFGYIWQKRKAKKSCE